MAFIVIEGIEGSGKSSLASALANYLTQLGISILLTKEPGGTDFGEKIRELILDSQKLDPKAETLLFLADRAQHLSELIRPALASGLTVICDRYIYSTIAYQGFARGLELGDVINFATGGLLPDKVILLDLPPSEGLARAAMRKNSEPSSWNRFEEEKLNFHEQVRQGFLSIRDERFTTIDATRPFQEVFQEALNSVTQLPWVSSE
jgi:dTMP kinase